MVQLIKSYRASVRRSSHLFHRVDNIFSQWSSKEDLSSLPFLPVVTHSRCSGKVFKTSHFPLLLQKEGRLAYAGTMITVLRWFNQAALPRWWAENGAGLIITNNGRHQPRLHELISPCGRRGRYQPGSEYFHNQQSIQTSHLSINASCSVTDSLD